MLKCIFCSLRKEVWGNNLDIITRSPNMNLMQYVEDPCFIQGNNTQRQHFTWNWTHLCYNCSKLCYWYLDDYHYIWTAGCMKNIVTVICNACVSFVCLLAILNLYIFETPLWNNQFTPTPCSCLEIYCKSGHLFHTELLFPSTSITVSTFITCTEINTSIYGTDCKLPGLEYIYFFAV